MKKYIITIALTALTVLTAQAQHPCYDWHEYIKANGDTAVAAAYCSRIELEATYSPITEDYSDNTGWKQSGVKRNRFTMGLNYQAKYDKMPVGFLLGAYVGGESNATINGFETGNSLVFGAKAGLETSHMLDWGKKKYHEDRLSVGVVGYIESRNFVVGDPNGNPVRSNGAVYGVEAYVKGTFAHIPVPTSYGKRLLPVYAKIGVKTATSMKEENWQNETERAKYNLQGTKVTTIKSPVSFFVTLGVGL